MRINNNITALNAWRNLNNTERRMGKTMEKLSSGLRINRAADDAAGLAISERMRGQVSGLDQAVANAQDGISLIQTGEGALDETHSILNRVRELTIQAANQVNEIGDVEKLQGEVDELINDIERIAQTTEFNKKSLLDGNLDGIELQLGANAGQSIQIDLINMDTLALGLAEEREVEGEEIRENLISFIKENGELNFSGVAYEGISGDFYTSGHVVGFSSDYYYVAETFRTADGTIYQTADAISAGNFITVDTVLGSIDQEVAEGRYSTGDSTQTSYFTDGGSMLFEAGHTFSKEAVITNTEFGSLIQIIDGAFDEVSAFRSKLGAVQNRLEHTINNLEVAKENLSAAESRIRDADMASEMMKLTRHQIMQQAGTAMLVQANMRPQGILQLLG